MGEGLSISFSSDERKSNYNTILNAIRSNIMKKKNTKETIEWLKLDAFGINGFVGVSGESALILAAENNNLELVNALLAEKVDLETQDKDGNTALIQASSFGHFDIVKALVDGGAQTDFDSHFHGTALNVAAYFDHAPVVEYLLKVKPFNNSKATHVTKALRTAIQQNNSDVVSAFPKSLIKEVEAQIEEIKKLEENKDAITASDQQLKEAAAELKDGISPS